jgi:cytochrome c-type biogenesis protein CcmE
MSRNLRFILIGLGIVGAICYLVFSGIQAQGVQYVRVSELVTSSSSTPETVKVTGKVQEGSIEYSPEKPLLKFTVSGPDIDGSFRVTYEGVKPDAMREDGHVILKGRYDPDRGHLKAHSLLAKCPSRYESKYESYDAESSSKS